MKGKGMSKELDKLMKEKTLYYTRGLDIELSFSGRAFKAGFKAALTPEVLKEVPEVKKVFASFLDLVEGTLIDEFGNRDQDGLKDGVLNSTSLTKVRDALVLWLKER
ncbi:MAG: hypothetical protein COB41_00055 [Proteobacteria bacterium]|nr:MAG: hypothetical protein COB41_00055 [Pseudomonadota bacterium]